MALFCIVKLSVIGNLICSYSVEKTSMKAFSKTVSLKFFAALTFYFWLAIIGASQEFKEKETRISPLTKDHELAVHEPYVIYE